MMLQDSALRKMEIENGLPSHFAFDDFCHFKKNKGSIQFLYKDIKVDDISRVCLKSTFDLLQKPNKLKCMYCSKKLN